VSADCGASVTIRVRVGVAPQGVGRGDGATDDPSEKPAAGIPEDAAGGIGYQLVDDLNRVVARLGERAAQAPAKMLLRRRRRNRRSPEAIEMRRSVR
jgi:hypothetical protein